MLSGLKDKFLKSTKKSLDIAQGQHSYMLQNGILLDIQSRKSRSITIDIKFNAGHHTDPDGKHVGHLLEHMISRRFNQAEKDNASITENNTFYDLRFLAGKGPKALKQFFGDIRRKIFDTTFDEDDVVREKKIVLIAEKAYRNKENSSDWHFDFPKTVMNNWRRYSADTEENLERTNVSDLQDYMAKNYVGNKMKITIKGPVNPLQTLYAIQDIFGDVPAGEIAPIPAPLIADYEPGEYLYPDQGMEQLDFTIGLVIPPAFHDKKTIKRFLTHYIWIAGQQAFREQGNQTLYAMNTKLCPHENMQFLLLHGEVLPHHAHKILPAYAQILSDLAQGRIDHETLEITRESCLHDWAGSYITEKDFYRVKPEDLAQMTRAMLDEGRISLIKRGIALESINLADFERLLAQQAAAPGRPSENEPDQAMLIPS